MPKVWLWIAGIAGALAIASIAFKGDARVQRWLADKDLLHKQVATLTADNGRLRIENQQLQIESDRVQVKVVHRTTDIHLATIRAAATPVPDTCKKVAADRDSVIHLQRDQIEDLGAQLDTQKRLTANLGRIDTNTTQTLTQAVTVADAAPVRPSLFKRLLPNITAGVGPAFTADDLKFHALAVNVSLSWKIN